MLSLLIFARMTLSGAIVITGVPSGLQSKEYVQTDEAQEHQPDDNPERDFPVLHSSPAIQWFSSFGGAGILLKDTLPAQDGSDGGTARHARGLNHQHIPAASEHTLCQVIEHITVARVLLRGVLNHLAVLTIEHPPEMSMLLNQELSDLTMDRSLRNPL